MKTVLVPLAEGFEEIEAITVIDILRRAGAEVVVAGVTENPVTAVHRTKHITDCSLEEVKNEDFDLVYLPGGVLGTTNLQESLLVKEILQRHAKNGKFVSAICAAPNVLGRAGILDGKTFTCNPSQTDKIVAGNYVESRLEIDGKIVTSKSAGTSMELAFKLVELLYGKEKADEINSRVFAKI
ncbi:DJ-1/PfpI family protein [bacterium]|nr:DJ-1/PfpI family protein [bacterium]